MLVLWNRDRTPLRWGFCLTLCLLVVAALGTPPAVANGIFGPKWQRWMAPGRLLTVELPHNWTVALQENDPSTFAFHPPKSMGEARLVISHHRLKVKADARQLLLKAMENRLGKLPNLKVVDKRTVTLAGERAAIVTATYDYQGNIQYPRTIEELHIVSGQDAYVFHFECFTPQAASFAATLNRIYKSFQARPPGASDHPFAVPERHKDVAVENLPF